jgi:undecaprenyl-diphosphatase
MLSHLQQLDQSIFLFLNGLHLTFLDPLFFYGTRSLIWLPLYLLLLWLVIRKYGWKTLWIMLAVFLMITISDQLSNLVKEWVARPRPTHSAGLSDVHTVNDYKGGTYGFYSAHASSNMAVAIFMIIMLGRPFRYFSLLMFSYAIFMSYTRIYLGVHYPGDILAGWLAGGTLGWGFGQVCGYFVQPAGKQG